MRGINKHKKRKKNKKSEALEGLKEWNSQQLLRN